MDNSQKMVISPVDLDDVDLKIGFIGAGKMAQALCAGFINASLIKPNNMVCSCRHPESKNLKAMSALGIHTGVDNREVVRSSDVVIIAVKPHVVTDVLQDAMSVVHRNHLIISVVAGFSTPNIERLLPANTRVIRVMPNTPTTVLCGAAAFARGSCTSPEDGILVSRLFSSVGFCTEVLETELDAVTGISGSGPAYVCLMIEAMADGAVKMGLNRDTAQKLAAHTLMGASKLILESGKHPAQLKDMVCSPGGTTISGIHQLEKSGLRAALMDAVEAATNQAKFLSRHGESKK